MSSSSTSVPATENQGPTNQPPDPQSRLRQHIAAAEALDAQLEAASRRDGARVPVHLANEGAAAANAKRHSRKCQICRHRDRDLIEADFLEWSHPSQICEDYKISYRALYRHATATGLLERRRENVCIVVHKLLEEVEYVENPSAFAILRAVRTLASLDSRGRWSEPPTTHVVVSPAVPQEPSQILSEAKGTFEASAPRQGTALAVPIDLDNSGVLTSEAGRTLVPRSEIRTPPNSFIANDSRISNR